MSGSSESTQTTTPVFKTTPNALGTTDYNTSARLFNQAEGLTTAGVNSPFSQPLQNAILNPSYGVDTQSEQDLLNSIMDLTAGRGAVSGLGAPTQAALASSIAPTLVDLRQRDIENLMGANDQQIKLWMAQLQALAELTGLAMPQEIVSTSSTGSSDSNNIVQDMLQGVGIGGSLGGD